MLVFQYGNIRTSFVDRQSLRLKIFDKLEAIERRSFSGSEASKRRCDAYLKEAGMSRLAVMENGEQELVRMLDQRAEPSGEASEEDDYAQRSGPDHLVVMVNGIVGSSSDWKFGADQFHQRMGDRVMAHCSASNSAASTFNGIDIMGMRLADEVRDLLQRRPSLKKISFVAHSLGGLVARYAIGKLYRPHKGRGTCSNCEVSNQVQGTLLGLQPINFITLATPHLGSRGHNQLPFLFGLRCMERLAPLIAHWFVGTTGKHLFFSDAKKNQPPLLFQMVTDCCEAPFWTALSSFKHRMVYANVVNDHMVGWRTSSLRRQAELPVLSRSSIDPYYPHIVHVEKSSPAKNVAHLPSEFYEANSQTSRSLDDDLIEDILLSKLTQLVWKRVDVWFKGSNQMFIGHSAIQVKDAVLHSHGTDVIAHLIDNFEV